jgi:hypothetical protein
LRTSALLSLSGALADCIAFGVPTVTTRDLAVEMEVPAYVGSTSGLSSLLVAEAIEELLRGHLNADQVEHERCSYLEERSADAYARRLLTVLGLQ